MPTREHWSGTTKAFDPNSLVDGTTRRIDVCVAYDLFPMTGDVITFVSRGEMHYRRPRTGERFTHKLPSIPRLGKGKFFSGRRHMRTEEWW